MRLCTSLLLATALTLPVLADPPKNLSEEAADRAKIPELVRDLDADAVETREAADSRLRAMGDVVLDFVRAAANDASLGPEGKVRAAMIASDLLVKKERRRLFGDNFDPAKEVRDELRRLGEPTDGWKFQALSSPLLDRALPRCIFLIADWTGAESEPIPSELFAVCREPAAVVRMRGAGEMAALSKWIPAAIAVAEKVAVAGILGGLEAMRSKWEGPYEFETGEAEATADESGGTTIQVEAARVFFHFDDKGTLVTVDYGGVMKDW